MPTIEAEFEVFCSCGNGLCANTLTGTRYSRVPYITVEPCEKCLDKAKDEGDDEGYKRGYDDGYSDERGK